MFILIIILWSDYLRLKCYKKPRGILMDHSRTSTHYHVSSGLLSTLGTAASSARAFLGSCLLPCSTSPLIPLAVVFMASPLCVLTLSWANAAHTHFHQAACAPVLLWHLPTASPAFLDRKEVERVERRKEVRCKKAAKLPCFMAISPLHLLTPGWL